MNTTEQSRINVSLPSLNNEHQNFTKNLSGTATWQSQILNPLTCIVSRKKDHRSYRVLLYSQDVDWAVGK